VITLTLVHPIPNLPAQSWTFETESVIRIGRSGDNHVILHSAVVSRHHVELRRRGCRWNLLNLSVNGTFSENQSITEAPVVDGMILRLAFSGPQLQIKMGKTLFKNLSQTFSNSKDTCQNTPLLEVI
jgi:pSer/pThr/pTyr-binding forkhead associated (FHA) protein